MVSAPKLKKHAIIYSHYNKTKKKREFNTSNLTLDSGTERVLIPPTTTHIHPVCSHWSFVVKLVFEYHESRVWKESETGSAPGCEAL